MSLVTWREVGLWINYVTKVGECSEEYRRRFHSVFCYMAKLPSLEALRGDILSANRDLFLCRLGFHDIRVSRLFFRAHITSILYTKFEYDEIKEVSEHLTALVQGSWISPQKKKILDAILNVPREQRGDFVLCVKPLLEIVTIDYLKWDLMRRVLPFPNSERIQIVNLALALIDQMSSESFHYALVDTLCCIEFSRREGVCRWAIEMMDGIRESQHRDTILFTVAGLSEDERDGVCQAAKELFTPEATAECRKQVLLGLKSIERDKIECIKNIGRFMQGYLDLEKEIPLIIKILRRLPPLFLKLVEDKISSFPKANAKNWLKSLSVLSYFPENIKNQLLNQIDGCFDCLHAISEYDLIFFLIAHDKRVKMQMWQYLFHHINTSSFRGVAEELIDKRYYFLLKEDSPLFEQASKIVRQNLPYSRDKKRLDSFARLLESSVQAVDHVHLCVYTFKDEEFILHPKIIHDSFPQTITVPILRSLHRDEMPSFLQWHEIIERFTSRVSSLNEEKYALVQQEVFQYAGQNLNDVLHNLRSIFFTYHITVHDEYDVPMHHAMMCSILASLKDQSAALTEGLCLSPQEKMLVVISCVIRGGNSSKLNGLYTMYGMLDRQYQYIDQEAFLYAPLKRRVYSSIQRYVFTMVCCMLERGSPFMNELLKGKLVYSPSLSLYLRNKIGVHVGIGNQVCFDDENTIDFDGALGIATTDLLNMFYRYFSPNYVVSRLRSFLKKGFEELSLLDDIASLLQEKLDPCALWEGDCLSEEGMVYLLREMGLFQVVR